MPSLVQQVPDQLFEFCYGLGAFTIRECLKFVEKGNSFLLKWQGHEGETGWIHDFDNSMFDVISGVFQLNKILLSNFLPGSFVKGILEAVNAENFLPRTIDFAVKITQFVEAALQAGTTMPMFRLSYLKVMWKDASLVVNTLLSSRFLPNDQ